MGKFRLLPKLNSLRSIEPKTKQHLADLRRVFRPVRRLSWTLEPFKLAKWGAIALKESQGALCAQIAEFCPSTHPTTGGKELQAPSPDALGSTESSLSGDLLRAARLCPWAGIIQIQRPWERKFERGRISPARPTESPFRQNPHFKSSDSRSWQIKISFRSPELEVLVSVDAHAVIGQKRLHQSTKVYSCLSLRAHKGIWLSKLESPS